MEGKKKKSEPNETSIFYSQFTGKTRHKAFTSQT